MNHMKYIMAKTDPENQAKWLPLFYHLKDTAGVMRTLISEWVPKSIARSLGISESTFEQVALFLALTHDIGKATPVFQQKVLGNYPEIASVLESAGLNVSTAMMNAKETPHDKAGAELLRRAGCPEAVAVIVGAHHGRPEAIAQRFMENIKEFPANYWGKKNREEWQEIQNELIDEALAESGFLSAEDLPALSVRAQMLLTGLIIMADWIASNTRYFPLISTERAPDEYDDSRWIHAMRLINLPKPWMVEKEWFNTAFFHERFGFEANMVQNAVLKTVSAVKEPGLMVLEAPMGVGKTEAALSAAEVLMNRFSMGGVAFFLPSQATSNAMFSRLIAWAKTQPEAKRLSVQLAHAMAEMNDEFASLEQGHVGLQEDAEQDVALTVNSFFRGRKTTLLADLVIGTVDQMLLAGLKQRHVMLRHLGLAGKVVIVDECHAYDAYMNRYLDCVLSWLGAYRVPVILLSATLPCRRREELIAAYLGKKKVMDEQIRSSEAYPLLCWTDGDQAYLQKISDDGAHRTVHIQKTEEDKLPDELSAVVAAGGCAGVIVNTVRRLQELAALIKQSLPQAHVLIDHSQFLAPDRLAHEQLILSRVGKHSTIKERAGVIVLGTQVLEQSLDLDFDLLVTDLCPMDLLLQRIGRLHRRERTRPEGLSQARCLVMHADSQALEDGACAVYGSYLLLRTCDLLPQVLHLPEDISPLVQKVYDESRWAPQTSEAYEQAKAEYALLCKSQKRKAGSYCMPLSWQEDSDSTLPEVMNSTESFTEPEARAAVRDGDSSVEVLMLGLREDGQAVLVSGEKRGQAVSTTCQPDSSTAREIAKQRIRLPGRFARSWNVEKTINSLQAETTRLLAEWEHSPFLQGELFLLLDERNEATLCDMRLTYDEQTGLTCKEDEHGTKRV